MGTRLDANGSVPVGVAPPVLTRSGTPTATRRAVGDDLIWFGDGVLPNESDIAQAIEVMAAVPLAGAIGWSVRGNPWSRHPGRLRTAVVPPRPNWDVTALRGVREVDSLSGRMLVRRVHLDALSDEDGSMPLSWRIRRAGFRLLLMGCR